eukprot:3728233-Prymnesium_polylepis.1
MGPKFCGDQLCCGHTRKVRLTILTNAFNLQDVFIFLPLSILFLILSSSGSCDHHKGYGAVIVGLATLATGRIAAFLGGVIFPADLLEQMDVTHAPDLKANLRSTWTNSALLGALLLSFAFPMAQVDFSDFEPTNDSARLFQAMYPMASFVAVAFAALGTLSPTIALLYSNQLNPKTTILMVLCHPWTLGNAFAYVLASFVWLLIALIFWEIQSAGGGRARGKGYSALSRDRK